MCLTKSWPRMCKWTCVSTRWTLVRAGTPTELDFKVVPHQWELMNMKKMMFKLLNNFPSLSVRSWKSLIKALVTRSLYWRCLLSNVMKMNRTTIDLETQSTLENLIMPTGLFQACRRAMVLPCKICRMKYRMDLTLFHWSVNLLNNFWKKLENKIKEVGLPAVVEPIWELVVMMVAVNLLWEDQLLRTTAWIETLLRALPQLTRQTRWEED